MRRFLVMEEARFPEPMQAAMRGLENRGHPYQGAVPARTAWARGLDVPVLAEKGAMVFFGFRFQWSRPRREPKLDVHVDNARRGPRSWPPGLGVSSSSLKR
jgi:hypothetical protein